MVYCFSYDLRKPGRNYDSLYGYLKSFASWCHALESDWFVVSDKTAAEVRDGALAHVDEGDGIVVTRATAGWATHGVSKEINDWLRDSL